MSQSRIDASGKSTSRASEKPFFHERRAHAPNHESELWDVLDTIEDPHLPISLVEMGMIYDVTVSDGRATVEMTFPCLGCPAYDMIQDDVKDGLATHESVDQVDIELVWDPVWSKDLLSHEVRVKLNEAGVGL